MATFTGGQAYTVTSVSFGIENAVANPTVGSQPVTVRLYTQTTGVFPAGTRTQLATTTVNVTDQMATALSVPLSCGDSLTSAKPAMISVSVRCEALVMKFIPDFPGSDLYVARLSQ